MIKQAADVAAALAALRMLYADLQGGNPAACKRLSRAMLEPELARLGITRVGDITGLDHIGIPVWFAARPASRSLCIANGKGITEEGAWLSAVMESAEQAIAEEASLLVSFVASRAAVTRQGLRSIPLERQARCAARRLTQEAELGWMMGLSLRTGEPVFAPYELVGMDMVSSAPWNTRDFRMSSLGLAAGGDLASAILHGLRELVEEDAIFGPLAGGAPAERRDVIFNRPCATGIAWAIEKLAERDIEARFVQVSDDIAMPVVMAALKPRHGDQAGLAYFCGSACRSTVEDAALAALLEAVQSRLTYISGARDDLYAEEYHRQLRPGTKALFGGHRFSDERPAEESGQDGSDDLAVLLAAVFAAGIGDVYAFPLGGCRYGFEVVRVLADDLVAFEAVTGSARTGRAGDKLLRRWMHS
ncbi:YcaO-like family protein [Mesorhizobium sp. WSM1293]|uniref:YcaO-like family protein n=1 Tax=Mesorhizobium sp. WSM1293 TaxID=1040984 RepID=UPI0004AEB4BF|nr:YcaO-like family protein [Mesorhizobium sp. WSM1293]